MGKRFELLGVSKWKDGPKRAELLRDINFTVDEGLIFTIMGPSGAGKSTLLTLLNRLEEPSAGQILLDGTPITQLEVVNLRRRVGMVFQTPALFPMTVEQNICYGPNLRQRREYPGLAARYLEMVGLDPELAGRDAGNLSVGQQQRVSIARTLANEPEVLLLDEPTSALDPTATSQIEELIRTLNQKIGLTIVWVTHDMKQAARVGDRTMLLASGEKVEEGETRAIFASSQNEVTRLFIAGRLNGNESKLNGDKGKSNGAGSESTGPEEGHK